MILSFTNMRRVFQDIGACVNLIVIDWTPLAVKYEKDPDYYKMIVKKLPIIIIGQFVARFMRDTLKLDVSTVRLITDDVGVQIAAYGKSP